MVRNEAIPSQSSMAAAPVSAESGAFFLQVGILVSTMAFVALGPRSFGLKDEEVIYPFCVLLVLHLCWVFWSWRRFAGTLLHPYPLVFLSAFFFTAGQAALEVFGLNPEGLLDGEFPSSTLARTLILEFCGLAAIHCGALFATSRSQGRPLTTAPTEQPSSYAASRAIGWSLLAVCAVPFMIGLVQSVSTVLSGGYMALYQKEIPKAGLESARLIIADFLVPGAFFLVVGSKGQRRERVVAASILFLYGCANLFIGYRAHGMMPLIGAAWLWDRCVWRLPRLALVAIGVVLLVLVFPLIKETRMTPGQERKSHFLVKAYAEIDSPAVDAVHEMGKSMAPLAHVLELVPKERGYTKGAEYLYALTTVIPSLFWDRHPVVARQDPAAWLIETVDPYTAAQGGGIGFSFIAEAFLNFGVWGIPLISFLFGYFFVRFCLWAEFGSAVRLAIVAAFLPHLLFYPRGQAMDLPRALAWYSLGPYVGYLMVRKRLLSREERTLGR